MLLLFVITVEHSHHSDALMIVLQDDDTTFVDAAFHVSRALEGDGGIQSKRHKTFRAFYHAALVVADFLATTTVAASRGVGFPVIGSTLVLFFVEEEHVDDDDDVAMTADCRLFIVIIVAAATFTSSLGVISFADAAVAFAACWFFVLSNNESRPVAADADAVSVSTAATFAAAST